MHQGDGLPNDERTAGGRRFAASHFTALTKCLLLLALLLPGPALAAGFTCTPPAESGRKPTLDELDEVIVTAGEATTKTKDLQAWLRLLVGKYTYEGYVDLCGQGHGKDQRPVTGNADCIGSGPTPNVHCTVNARWPETRGENGMPVTGGVSNLLPALVSYSLENRHIPDPRSPEVFTEAIRTGRQPVDVQTSFWGLMFFQVDNRGTAEWGSGTLVGDTFTSREPCVDIGMAGDCVKITRITAKENSDEISMLVDVQIESRRVLRQVFLLHRESSRQENAHSRDDSP